MLFSLLMAHYNNARFLKESLNSVYAQTYTNWEVILVDDGSTDEFETVIKEFENDQRIKIFRNGKNMGCAFTKRKLTEKAIGDVLGFLDPDDTLEPKALEIMVNAHSQKPECSLIYSTHFICDENLKDKSIAGYQRTLNKNETYLLLNDGSIHHFATFKKSSYDKTEKLYPGKEYDLAIDQDLYYLLEEEGNIFFINKPLYNYRIHNGGISSLHNKSKALKAHYLVIEKSCLRRIEKLKFSKSPDAGYWKKRYKTRYHKIHILNSFHRQNWTGFLSSLFIFPFVGGMNNVVSYFKKLPREGLSLLKKSFG